MYSTWYQLTFSIHRCSRKLCLWSNYIYRVSTSGSVVTAHLISFPGTLHICLQPLDRAHGSFLRDFCLTTSLRLLNRGDGSKRRFAPTSFQCPYTIAMRHSMSTKIPP